MEKHVSHLKQMFNVLLQLQERLFAYFKKCSFCFDKNVFLGFVVSGKEIEVNEEKLDSIKTWPTLIYTTEERSFHGLACFYRRLVIGLVHFPLL